jgi:hypothetical protein
VGEFPGKLGRQRPELPLFGFCPWKKGVKDRSFGARAPAWPKTQTPRRGLGGFPSRDGDVDNPTLYSTVGWFNSGGWESSISFNISPGYEYTRIRHLKITEDKQKSQPPHLV